MDIYTAGLTLCLVVVAHRATIVFYRLYLHPLARFPGPKLASASTLYRAYYQLWKDGKLLHKTIELEKKYGPIIRISPNELEFCNPSAFYDIYSYSFNGTKDPDFYGHLIGEAETFFTMKDRAEHRRRFRPIASVFSKKQYERYEINIKKSVEHFCGLLHTSAQRKQPCNLAQGYRSLFLEIMIYFIFSDIPEKLRLMQNERFDDPLTLATSDVFNWTEWLARNFPVLATIVDLLPRSLVSSVTTSFEGLRKITEIIGVMVEHEKTSDTPKNEDCMMQCLLSAHLKKEFELSEPFSDPILRAEAAGMMMAGSMDQPNIIALGTFMVASDANLQQRLYNEVKVAWPNLQDSIPSYETLRRLPLLRGVIQESLRLSYGAVTGPSRVVSAGGARIDGHFIPAKAVVAASSYFVQMDTRLFPDPEKFDPERWIDDDFSNAIVVFSRGRLMCPAEQFTYIEFYATFATVFRRFHMTPYETTIKDFEWNQYFSTMFTGRPLRAILQERVD